MYQYFNNNPSNKLVGDCVIRAISIVTEEDWEHTYLALCLQGLFMHDMPSSNAVWGAYLMQNGYERHSIPNYCPECYTIADFAMDYPNGTYILSTGTHVVAVVDGSYMDSWDSGSEIPQYFWQKEN